jgi:hypothetical protein
MRKRTGFTIAVILFAPLWLYSQSEEPKDLLQERLNTQFALTKITKDRTEIVSFGRKGISCCRGRHKLTGSTYS